MEIEYTNYKSKKTELTFKIKGKTITGITGMDPKELIEILKLQNNYSGTVKMDNIEITNKNINLFKTQISSTEDFNTNMFFKNIYEEMEYIMKHNNMYPKNIEKRIKDAIKIVGLNQTILEKNINLCSNSEIKILKLAFSLLLNPNIIIINEPFKGIDLINQKKIMILLRKISEKYNKLIIFISNNSEILYKYTDNMIIIKNNKVLLSGKTKDVYQKVDILIDNNIDIPKIVNFTYQAKRKKVKIDYHTDIRDLIKDIYKHV